MSENSGRIWSRLRGIDGVPAAQPFVMKEPGVRRDEHQFPALADTPAQIDVVEGHGECFVESIDFIEHRAA